MHNGLKGISLGATLSKLKIAEQRNTPVTQARRMAITWWNGLGGDQRASLCRRYHPNKTFRDLKAEEIQYIYSRDTLK